MNKKVKPNRFKPGQNENPYVRSDSISGSSTGVYFCLKCIMGIVFVSILSLGSIFIFDLVTQSNFFRIKQVEISGTNRVSENEIIELAQLTLTENIFSLNLYNIEDKITSHPWIQSAKVNRDMSFDLLISIIEQKPLAIVKIENLTDILINTHGHPFKEYNPQKDQLNNLPIVTGLDLTNENNHYLFNGVLFNSVMDFFKSDKSDTVLEINGNEHTGITIKTLDTFNQASANVQETMSLTLGFNNFNNKLNKAKTISEYIDKHFPDRTICAMDLFDIEKVFIKTKLSIALHDNLAKGV